MAESKKHDALHGEILHEYDGILEADNRLPNWWLATFFGAIVFAGVYWGWYETFHVTPDTRAAYAAAMLARAGDAVEPTPELLETVASDPSVVASGRSVFESNCQICHGANAEGVVGPNLTDGAWIHGGAPMDIYTTVHDGVAARAMPAWGEQLPPRVVLNVVAYVLSVRNTNVPGRPPEGPPATGAVDTSPGDEAAAPPTAPPTDAVPSDPPTRAEPSVVPTEAPTAAPETAEAPPS